MASKIHILAACVALFAFSAHDASAACHWSFGPFAEYSSAGFAAIRPFWSRTASPSGQIEHDLLWPLATYHGRPSRSWWRAGPLIGSSSSESTPRSSAMLFPLAFYQTENSSAYWGLFPIYGHHPHILLMDDFSFALWPFYHTYTISNVRSHAILWPFITWRESPRSGFGLWPFYGFATHRESTHRYALWPLATWATYLPDRDTSGAGYSWMLFPLAGRVSRQRENQYLFLPPLFSYSSTPQTRRLRAPWPFFEYENGPRRKRLSIFPLYESIASYPYSSSTSPVETTHRIGFRLIEHTRISDSSTSFHRFAIFPFWTRETSSNGSTFTRLWPFWSRSTLNGSVVSERILDLNPIRHSPAIDRNWASFWSLYRRETLPDGSTCHHFLFDFFWWHTKAPTP